MRRVNPCPGLTWSLKVPSCVLATAGRMASSAGTTTKPALAKRRPCTWTCATATMTRSSRTACRARMILRCGIPVRPRACHCSSLIARHGLSCDCRQHLLEWAWWMLCRLEWRPEPIRTNGKLLLWQLQCWRLGRFHIVRLRWSVVSGQVMVSETTMRPNPRSVSTIHVGCPVGLASKGCSTRMNTFGITSPH